MNKLGRLIAVLGLPVFLASHHLHAEDIDLYTGMRPAETNDVPTILLVWDNAANTSASASPVCTQYADGSGAPSLGINTAAGMEQCAMYNALYKIKSTSDLQGKIKIGLMMFNHNKFKSGNGECGYLKFAPKLMDSTNVTALMNDIKGFDNNIKANSVKLGGTMAEAWAMLNGRDASLSCSGVDYSWYLDEASQCRDGVVVYIGNAFTNSNPSDNNSGPEDTLKKELTSPSAFNYATSSNEYKFFTDPIAVPLINTSGKANSKYWADEWTRFMKRVSTINSTLPDKNITTYTIAVTDFDNQSQAQPVINYYAEMAKQGGGKSVVVDYRDTDGLTNALLNLFNDVQAKNSVFASATLPVAANTQGTYLNQVFIAMFRPAEGARPRWYGNLKQYHFGLDSGGNIVLTDSTYDPDAGPVVSKTNPETGALSTDAVSFWTMKNPAVTGWPSKGFWFNAASGVGLQYDSPDGDLVEKGGTGQMLRVDNVTASYASNADDNSRRLLTCNGTGTCGTLTEFDIGNTYLTSNSSSVLGVSETGVSTVSITAGVPFTSGFGSCQTGGSRTCSIKVPFGTNAPEIDVNTLISNRLDLSLKQAACLLSQGCSVTAVTSTDFTYTVTGDTGATYSVPAGTTFHKADRSITAASANHPYVKGQKLIIRACKNTSNSAAVTGLSTMPTGTSGAHVTVSSTTTDTFTFNWDNAAIALPDANVSCEVESALTAKNLINWVRGWDIADNEDLAGPCRLKAGAPADSSCVANIRPSIHGDVLHSRPAVVNYGTDQGSDGSESNIVVFYGGNDGIFRAVNGNQTKSFNGVRPGGELWGFIAPEFHGKFRRLFNNAPLVDIDGVMDPDKQPKDYFFDGSTTVLRDERAGTSTSGKTYLYMTARRGGRVIYSLDVSDPMNPAFLWSLSNSQIPELGQTWSQPKVALLPGRDNPVIIMGAGYSPEQDADAVSASDTMGRGVMILDAVTGEVVRAWLASCGNLPSSVCSSPAGLTHSVAADVTIIDRNSDGLIDRVYAADTGANIWRIDLQPNGFGTNSLPADWQMTKFADLGHPEDSAASSGRGGEARKFLFAPDVVMTKDFDVVMAVSGDREHPLFLSGWSTKPANMAYNVQNRIYMLKDPYTGARMDSNFTPLTDRAGENVLVDNPDSNNFNASSQTVKGYYIDLPNHGEKGVNAPITVAGKTYFATNYPDVPDSSSCSADLGIALAYTVDFMTGKTVTSEFVGGGLPPSPVSGIVEIGGNNIPFIIGGGGPTTFDPTIPPIELNNNRKRAYWYAK